MPVQLLEEQPKQVHRDETASVIPTAAPVPLVAENSGMVDIDFHLSQSGVVPYYMPVQAQNHLPFVHPVQLPMLRCLTHKHHQYPCIQSPSHFRGSYRCLLLLHQSLIRAIWHEATKVESDDVDSDNMMLIL